MILTLTCKKAEVSRVKNGDQIEVILTNVEGFTTNDLRKLLSIIPDKDIEEYLKEEEGDN